MAAMRFSQKGFTLIELLVVISIIAMLAAIILASLNSARAKGKRAVVQSELKQMQDTLEIYQLTSGIYPDINTGGGCSAGTTCSKSVLFNPSGQGYGVLSDMRAKVMSLTNNGFRLCTNGTGSPAKYSLYAPDPASSDLICRDSLGGTKTYSTWPSVDPNGNCFPLVCQ